MGLHHEGGNDACTHRYLRRWWRSTIPHEHSTWHICGRAASTPAPTGRVRPRVLYIHCKVKQEWAPQPIKEYFNRISCDATSRVHHSLDSAHCPLPPPPPLTIAHRLLTTRPSCLAVHNMLAVCSRLTHFIKCLLPDESGGVLPSEPLRGGRPPYTKKYIISSSGLSTVH